MYTYTHTHTHTHTDIKLHIYKCIDKHRHRSMLKATVIIVGNGISNPSSIPGQGC